MVHSAHISQGRHGDTCNHRKVIRYLPFEFLRLMLEGPLQLGIFVPVDFAILFGQILIDLVLLDLGCRD